MNQIKLLILFLAVNLTLLADYSNVATGGDSNSLLNNHLSALTGQVIDRRHDLLLPAKEPIYFDSIFTSLVMGVSKINGVTKIPFLHAEYVQSKYGGKVSIFDQNGSKIDFHGDKKKKGRKVCTYEIHPSMGMTNTASGGPSGQTNIRNIKVVVDWEKDLIKVIYGDGTSAIYGQSYRHGQKFAEGQARRFLLLRKQKKNGSWLVYSYHDDHRLRVIESFSINMQHKYGIVYFNYYHKDKEGFEVVTSQNKKLQFHFSHVEKDYTSGVPAIDFHESVHSPYQADRSYYFDKHQLDGIEAFGGRLLKFDYYDDKRIQFLKAPIGSNNEVLVALKMQYHLTDDLGSGVTEVRGAFGRKDTYCYSNNFTLNEIIHFGREGEKDHPSYKEKFRWISKGDLNHLYSKAVIDSENNGVLSTVYHYDDRGNTIREEIIGNFTGKLNNKIRFHENGSAASAVEKIKTHSEYDNQCNRLTKRKNSDGTVETFSYFHHTHLVTSHLTYNRSSIIIQRKFFHYDQAGILRRTIEDDGCKVDWKDLTNVNVRSVIDITPTPCIEGLDLPWIVKRYCEDSSGNKKLLGKSIFTYSPEGWITQREEFDGNEASLFTTHKRYDSHGNVIYETDPMGEEIHRQYDTYNNLIKEHFIQKGVRYKRAYNCCNKMISETEITSLGERTTRFEYDVRSRKIKETDYLGRDTRFVYDSFDNLLEVRHPQFSSSSKLGLNRVDKTIYDSFKRPERIFDPFGNNGHIEYNSLGQPIKETRFDGQQTKTIYNLDQTIAKKVLPDGTYVAFEYDDYKHVVKTLTYDKFNNLLSQVFAKYQGSLLVEDIDELGVSTCYRYDAASRVIEQKKCGQKTTFVYDASGHICEEIAHLPEGRVKTIKSYDILGRVVEQKTLFKQQESDHIKLYYDHFGNVAVKSSFTNNGVFSQKFKYDARNRLVKHTDPEENETCFEYGHSNEEVILLNYKHPRARKKVAEKLAKYKKRPKLYYDRLPKEQREKIRLGAQARMKDLVTKGKVKWETKTTISPKGLKTIEYYNEVGLLAKIEKYDLLEQKCQHEVFDYDIAFRKVKQTSTVIFQNKFLEQIETRWFYDMNNNVVKIVEGKSGRTTKMNYTLDGLVETLTKMNGAILHYEYDTKRMLSRVYSESNDIDYRYKYDIKGRVIEVTDQIHNRVQKMKYDSLDNLLEETLANGLEMKFTYDGVGRREQTTLPDTSSIEYQYEGLHLKKVKRGSEVHTYEEFDTTGALLKESMMFDLASTQYRLDKGGRIASKESDIFSHHLQEFDKDGLLTKEKRSFDSGEYDQRYQYDGLNQLVKEYGAILKTYEFDSHHNLHSKNGEPTKIGKNHQLEVINGKRLEYDLNGNRRKLTEYGLSTTYKYDSLDRLVEVTTSEEKIFYEYDSDGRCILRREGEEQELYLYDGRNEIGMLRNDKIEQLRILGDTTYGEIGSAILLELNGKKYIPVHDLSGDVVLLMTSEGEEVQKYMLSSFGEVSILDTRGQEMEERVENPWVVQSKRKDKKTGLVNFGLRFYDAEVGMFINPDPQGLAEIPNPYAYMYNNPRAGCDVYGLEPDINNQDWALHRDVSYAPNSSDTSDIARYKKTMQIIRENNQSIVPESSWRLRKYISKNHLSEDQAYYEPFEDDNSCIYKIEGKKVSGGGITFVNGNWNSLEDSKDNALFCSDRNGGAEVSCVYNATRGKYGDLKKSKLCSRDGRATKASAMQIYNWLEYDEGLAPNGYIFHECHSDGAIVTNNSLKMSPKYLKDRLIVLATAPGVHIKNTMCYSVVQLKRRSDLPYRLDAVGHLKENLFKCSTSIYAKRHKSVPWYSLDHEYQSLSYIEEASRYRSDYLEESRAW